MKKHFAFIGIVLANLIASFLVAVAVAMFVPIQVGTTILEKEYSSYSKEELKSIADKQSAGVRSQSGLLGFIRDRGTALQVVVWLVAIFLVTRVDFQFLSYSGLGLALGFLLGLFSLNQSAIIFGFIVAAVLLKRRIQRTNQETT